MSAQSAEPTADAAMVPATTDAAAQKAKEAVSKGLNSLLNPNCYGAEAVAIDAVKTVIKAVPVLAGLNAISGGILYKVIDKVISVNTLKTVRDNPNLGSVLYTLVLNDPDLKGMMSGALPSLEGIKNFAGNIPGVSTVGGAVGTVGEAVGGAAGAVGGAVGGAAGAVGGAVGGAAGKICGGIACGINSLNPWGTKTALPVPVSAL